MESPDTLDAGQVAALLGVNRNMVYRLVHEGALSSFNVGRKLRFQASDVESFIAASRTPPSRSLRLDGPALPSSLPPSAPMPGSRAYGTGLASAAGLEPAGWQPSRTEAFMLSGRDPILDTLASYLAGFGIGAARSYSSSYCSLADLYAGSVNAAAIQLWDAESGTCNIPYVKHLLPGTPCIVFFLASIGHGFITSQGDAGRFRDWPDLLAPEARIGNRERGSGARVLLDEHLIMLEADHSSIKGYARELPSELALANFIARGGADVGVASEHAYHQVHGLGYVPLQPLELALVVRKMPGGEKTLHFLRSLLASSDFRNEFKGLPGYDTSRMGRVIYEV